VPFVVAAPESTIDPATPDGTHIEIEQRAEREVLELAGVRITPPGARAWNPAFDVTPHDLVTVVATERRIWAPG
jgi:methylthioribose-1-phosphate isomerase